MNTQDNNSTFGLAVRLADEISKLDMDNDAKERIATVNLIRDALRDHSAQLQAENARLREALKRCEYLSSGAAYDSIPLVRTINDAARQALSGGQGGESANS